MHLFSQYLTLSFFENILGESYQHKSLMGMPASEETEELHKAVLKALDQLQGEYDIA